MLAILSQRETYGYEIVQALEKYGFGAISEGTVYPLLLRGEKNGVGEQHIHLGQLLKEVFVHPDRTSCAGADPR